ncbi:MAG TPA: hypothetical protein VHM26_03355, partial [Chitinophagaceae bacterium]|nr:hypothetical protein [Chitinophagaceae bacterium]
TMKKIMNILPLTLLLALTFAVVACNNDKDEPGADAEPTGKTIEQEADSLWEQVMDGHDVGMAKMTKLEKAQEAVQRAIDSIGKLPAAAKTAAASLKTKLDSLQKDLKYASFAMDKWMEEFNADIKNKAADVRIKYLNEENLKVSKVKEAILGSLGKADSLLKTKF